MEHRKTFDRELEELKKSILKMSASAHELINGSILAFDRCDAGLAKDVIAGDEEIDRLNRDINQRCIELLALRQPEASDLRFLVTAMRIAADLERVGDHATNIGEDVIYMVEGREVKHGGKS